MQITCEFPHDQYGTLILSGQYHEADAECNLHANAVLESVLTYDGEELLQYDNRGPIGFSPSEIREMEDALMSDGEPANRVKPTAQTLDFVRAATLPKSNKDMFLTSRESEAAIDQGKRRKMQPWSGKDEPNFQVETPNPWQV